MELKPLVIFNHGKESGPAGRKILQLQQIAEEDGANTISIDYTQTQDPAERVTILLNTELPAHQGLILVGSSMGGYVSTEASETLQPDGLLLMAPAIGLAGYSNLSPTPVARDIAVVHGWDDEVVPVEQVIAWARKHKLKMVLVQDDHSLHQEIKTVGKLLTAMIKGLHKPLS